MKNINEMYIYLKNNCSTHQIEIKDNIIIAKRMIKTRSFASFKLTYIKNKNRISFKNTSFDSYVVYFTNDEDLICQLGSVSDVK